MADSLIGFAVLAGLLTMLPGIDTAQVLRSATLNGPRAAYATVFGIMAGVWIWGAAAAIGISALLLASQLLYRGFLLVSAGYLLYLGIKMLRESRHIQDLAADNSTPTRKGWKEFSRAFIVTFTNPKNGAFYVAILPQFLPENMHPIAGGLLLATIHNLECFIWFSILIWGTNLARNFFARTQVRVWLERISGIALIGFGIRMAMEIKS